MRRTLAKSASFKIVNDYESAVLVDTKHGTELDLKEHYGDPSCALISIDETYFVVGGEGITLFAFERGEQEYFRPGKPPHADMKEPWSVHAIRAEPDNSCRILFDPWSNYASVWRLSFTDGQVEKLQDGPLLKDEPYREDIDF